MRGRKGLGAGRGRKGEQRYRLESVLVCLHCSLNLVLREGR